MSGTVMDALKGIPPEQLFQIIQLVQSGQLQLPQMATGAQPGTIAQPAVEVLKAAAAIPSVSSGAPAEPNSIMKDVNVDKEEGEVEEGEEQQQPGQLFKESGFLRPPPTGPRRPNSSPRRQAALQRNNGGRDAVGGQPRPDYGQIASTGERPLINGGSSNSVSKPPAIGNHRAFEAGARARNFVLQLHNAGYTFEQLAQEIPNVKALRRMYKALGLPLPEESNQAPIIGRSQSPLTASQTDGTSRESAGAGTEPRPLNVNKRIVPSKPIATTREEYLAKLAAAKSKSKAAAGPQALPETSQTPSDVAPKSKVLGGAHEAISSVAPVPEQSPAEQPPPLQTQPPRSTSIPKGKVQTELIKQRLALLKAAQAAKANTTGTNNPIVVAEASQSINGGSPTMSAPTEPKPPEPGLGAGIDAIGAMVSQPQSALQSPPLTTTAAMPRSSFQPPPPTPGRSFSALPGLFIASPVISSPTQLPQPALGSATRIPSGPDSTPSAQSTSSNTLEVAGSMAVAQKRSVTADFDADLPDSLAPGLPKRPTFGLNRHDGESKRVVIEVSEEEEEEGEEDDSMDIEYQTAQDPLSVQQNEVQSAAIWSDASKSVELQPAPLTPLAMDEAERRRMIDDLNRQIAEKEAKRKARLAAQGASRSGSGKTTPVAIEATAPQRSAAPFTEVSEEAAASRVQTTTTTTAQTLHSASSQRQQQRAQLEQRIRDLQEETARRNLAVPLAPSLSSAPASATLMADSARPAAQTDPSIGHDAAGRDDTIEDEEIDDDSVDLYGEEPNVSLSASQAMDTKWSGTTNPEVTTVDAGASFPSQPSHVGPAGLIARQISCGGDDVVDHEKGEVDGPREAQEEGYIDDGGVELKYGHSQSPMAAAAGDIGYIPSDHQHRDSTASSDGSSIASSTSAEDKNRVVVDSDDAGVPSTQSVMAPATTGEELADEHTESVSDGSSESSDERSADLDTNLPFPAEDVDEEYEPAAGNDGALGAMEEQGPMTQPPTSSTSEEHTMALAEIGSVAAEPPMSGSFAQAETDGNVAAPELQPPTAEQADDEDQPTERHRFYRPYVSPLRWFRDFRYHPAYLDIVSGGFRSLTYNHRIDDKQPLCPHEAAGGLCNDKDCAFQHFKTMAMSDDNLLKSIATDKPSINREDVEWNAGLTEVIGELRETLQNKDANVIAARLVRYRREYIGDETRVLNLD